MTLHACAVSSWLRNRSPVWARSGSEPIFSPWDHKRLILLVYSSVNTVSEIGSLVPLEDHRLAIDNFASCLNYCMSWRLHSGNKISLFSWVRPILIVCLYAGRRPAQGYMLLSAWVSENGKTRVLCTLWVDAGEVPRWSAKKCATKYFWKCGLGFVWFIYISYWQ